MSLMDTVAVIGALAWLPPIISTLRNWFTKPEVRVITQPSPEIGYTTFGPILNLRVALAVSHKDIVITGIHLRVRHESGELTTFSWRMIVQRMGTMTFPDNLGAVPFEKEMNVLAMKVAQKDIEERSIRFQSLDFIQHKSELEAISSKKAAYLRQTDSLDPQTFLNDQTMVDLYSYIRQAFSWKPGEYQLQVIMESPDAFRVTGDKYAFTLSPLHAQNLSDNLRQIEKSYRNELAPMIEGEEMKTLDWNWVYPEMRQI